MPWYEHTETLFELISGKSETMESFEKKIRSQTEIGYL